MSLPKVLISILLCLFFYLAESQSLSVYKSEYSVSETTDRLVTLIEQEGLTFFETIIYDSIAAKGNHRINPTRVVLFEEPNLVTKLISCRQTTALEFPLKILVWEENEDVYIGYVDPNLMKKKFLLRDCEDILDELTRLMIKLANKVIRSS